VGRAESEARRVWVPFVQEIVPVLDVEGGCLRISLPAGLWTSAFPPQARAGEAAARRGASRGAGGSGGAELSERHGGCCPEAGESALGVQRLPGTEGVRNQR